MKLIMLFSFFSLIVQNALSQNDAIRIKELERLNASALKMETENPKEALNFFMDQERKFSGGKYTDVVAQRFYNYVARFYDRQGLYEEGLKIVEDLEINSKTLYYQYYITGADIYSNLKNFKKSIEYNKKFLTRAIEEKDTVKIVNAYINLSDDYIELRDPDKVFEQLSRVLLFINVSDMHLLALYHHNLGVAYMLSRQFDSAQFHLERGFKLDEKFSEDKAYDLPYDYFELGNLEESQNHFKEALVKYDSALLFLNKGSSMDLELKIYKAIYSVCDQLSEYKKGFKISLKYTNLRDSIFSVERLQNLGSMELENYLIQKQKEERDSLNRERQIQFSGVFFFLLIILMLTVYSKKFNVNQKVLGNILFITTLLFFEFMLVVLEPIMNKLTGNTPIYVLLGNFAVAILFVPINRTVERWFERKVLHVE